MARDVLWVLDGLPEKPAWCFGAHLNVVRVRLTRWVFP